MLEKILQEIEKHSIEFGVLKVIDVEKAKEIILSHMGDDGWIPVEQPPEEAGWYLATKKSYFSGSLYVAKAEFTKANEWKDNSGLGNIIAWKPLPEPYRPKEEN